MTLVAGLHQNTTWIWVMNELLPASFYVLRNRSIDYCTMSHPIGKTSFIQQRTMKGTGGP